MKKLERQKKAKKLAHDEEVKLMKQMTVDKGQGFVDYEIPPDEVDEEKLRRSLYTSIMTFIPYTNEYYEALAAEEEMDDLGKIRIEKVKAQDLYAMSKVGRHEDALQSMMAETNYDFFYFNKLKMKMELEGKFKFNMPDNTSLFSALDSGPNRNRLRKAINQVYNALGGKLTDELQRLGQVSSAGRAASAAKDHDGDEPCVWRGKNKAGDAMKCENHRFERPTFADPLNPNKKKKKEFFQYCCYHVPFCISDLHEVGQSIKIKTPNDQALCAECYMLKNKKRPILLTSDGVPGVIPVTLINAKHLSKMTEKDGENDSDDEKNKEKAKKKKGKNANAANPNQCPWQPTPEEANAEPALRKFECCNDKYKDEATQFVYPYCLWHQRLCIRDHSNDENSVGLITVPNAHGLCMMHFLAEFHDKPPNPPFPFPGMKFRRKKDFWKHDPLHSHWALPRLPTLPLSHRAPPPPDVVIKEYTPPEPPESMAQQTNKWLQLQFYKRRLKKEGNRVAIIVQKYFRGYRERNMLLSLTRKIDERELRARLFQGIMIQAQMRRYLAIKHVSERRARYNHAAREIQRLYRGSVVRAMMRRLRAAKRIKKFMKRLHFFKFRDAVILIMSIRRMFRKRNATTIMLQRIYRGYKGRMFVFYKKLWTIITKSMTRILKRALTRYVRRFREWKKRQVKWVRPTEEALRERLVKKLGALLTMCWQQQRQRQAQRLLWTEALQPMQSLARGYLARVGMRNLRTLRKQLVCWVSGVPYEPPTASVSDETWMSASHSQAGAGNISAMDLVMNLMRQHRIKQYTVPSHISISRSIKQTALLTYKHRANSVMSSVSSITGGAMTTPSVGDATTDMLSISSDDQQSVEAGKEFWFVRKYVPVPFCYWAEIDKKKQFLPALHRWYQDDQHLSLMTSEQTALIRRFTNRVNNKIMIEVLDMYIAQHPLPCRKHGRRVCGTCFYRRHCLLPSCHCQCYSNHQPVKKLITTATIPTASSGSIADGDNASQSTATGTAATISLPTMTSHNLGICVQCDHPINMHAICPLQYPKPFSVTGGNTHKRGRQRNPTALLEEQLEFLTEEEIHQELQKLKDAKTMQALAVAPQRIDPSGASVGTMLEIIRTVNEPDMSMPIGVCGVPATQVIVPALVYDDERQYHESIAHRQAQKLQRLLRKHFLNKSTKKLTAKTTKGSSLERNLKEQGISAALQSPVIQSLKSTIRLRHTLQQTIDLGGETLGVDSSLEKQITDDVLVAAESLLQGTASGLLVKELASMQIEGDSVALNNTYWEEEVMPSALLISTQNSPAKSHYQNFLQQVSTDARVPEPRNPDWAKPSNPRFWDEVVAKNPNKSSTDYHEGFDHNMPVPLLLPPKHRVGDSKELVYTFEGGKLYYNILWQIIQMADSVEAQQTIMAKSSSKSSKAIVKRQVKRTLADVISPDHSPFLSLVMNHIQIFERHWRKMVADLRTGSLDRHLTSKGSISQDAKAIFEATQMARPALAQQLDDCFRQLGFHKKVLGKDIEIKSLAHKKTSVDRRRILQRVEQEGKYLRGEISAEDMTCLPSSKQTSSLSRPLTREDLHSQSSTNRGGANLELSSSLSSIEVGRSGLAPNRKARTLEPLVHDRQGKELDSQDWLQTFSSIEDGRTQGKPSSSPQKRRYSMPIAVEADTNSRPVTAMISSTLSPRTALGPLADTLSPPKSSHKQRTAEKLSSPDPALASSQRDVFLKSLSQASSERVGSAAGAKKSHQEEIFAQAVVAFEPENLAERALLQSASAQFRSSGAGKRRKSASQAQLLPSSALSDEALHAINYDLVTDARDKNGYTSLVRLASTGRFVCPFPACGMMFLTADVGFQHMRMIHANQTRLYAATPQTDAMMRFYWPKSTGVDQSMSGIPIPEKESNPFQLHAKNDGVGIPPGSAVCPVPSCRGQTFSTRYKWEAHLRMVHHLYHFAHEKHRFWVASDPHAHNHPDAPPSAQRLEGEQDAESFHVTTAMQQQTFHRHGGAKVLKTIPPDPTQPLFNNEMEYDEFELLEDMYGEDVFTSSLVMPPLVVPSVAIDNAHLHHHHSGSGSAGIGSNQSNKSGKKGRLAALKHRAQHGFGAAPSSASHDASSQGGGGRSGDAHGPYLNLVHVLRHDPTYYAGIGRRKVLPSFCPAHATTVSQCLRCVHADADYDAHRDASCSAQQLRERAQFVQQLTSHQQSVYYARPHAPFLVHYAMTIQLQHLADLLHKYKVMIHPQPSSSMMVENAADSTHGEIVSPSRRLSSLPQVTDHKSGKTTTMTTTKAKAKNAASTSEGIPPLVVRLALATSKASLPPLLRQALPSSAQICLLHGDDQHVMLIERDVYTQHSVDIASMLPAALRRSNLHGENQDPAAIYAHSSYRVENATHWPAHFLVRPMFLVEDRDKLAWVGCEPVFTPLQLWEGDALDVLQMFHTPDDSWRDQEPCLRLFDRDSGDELTPLLASSMAHELLTATALLTQYDTRLPDDAIDGHETADRHRHRHRHHRRCRGICALLSSPERLLWLPMHCVAAMFRVSYLSAPPAPPLPPSAVNRTPDKEGNGNDDNNDASTMSSFRQHQAIKEEKARREEELFIEDEFLTPLARWKRRQEAIVSFVREDKNTNHHHDPHDPHHHSIVVPGDNEIGTEPLVPTIHDIAPARFFIRI